MALDDLPEDVLDFLGTYIDSVEELSILLLLCAQPERVWTTSEIVRTLRSAENSIATRLENLYARKILNRLSESGDLHKFTPSTSQVAEVIRHLAEQNQIRPYRIIEAIYSRPKRAIQQFANAFRFRKGKE